MVASGRSLPHVLGGQQEEMAQLRGPVHSGVPLGQATCLISQRGSVDGYSWTEAFKESARLG